MRGTISAPEAGRRAPRPAGIDGSLWCAPEEFMLRGISLLYRNGAWRPTLRGFSWVDDGSAESGRDEKQFQCKWSHTAHCVLFLDDVDAPSPHLAEKSQRPLFSTKENPEWNSSHALSPSSRNFSFCSCCGRGIGSFLYRADGRSGHRQRLVNVARVAGTPETGKTRSSRRWCAA